MGKMNSSAGLVNAYTPHSAVIGNTTARTGPMSKIVVSKISNLYSRENDVCKICCIWIYISHALKVGSIQNGVGVCA